MTPEIQRIREEYSRRDREIAPGHYSWKHSANYFMHVQCGRAVIRGLTRAGLFPLDGARVADIGCGTGVWLCEFLQWGAELRDLHGIELNESRLAVARRRLPGADLHEGDAQELPWRDRSLDIVTQFTVFTSVLDPEVKTRLAAEMWRVLRPGGAIVWYDFRVNNPSNASVRGIGVREIRKLFPHAIVHLASVTLLPPLTRRISWSAATALEVLPFLRTHYAGTLKKPFEA
ncbi:MAG: class I SAM-dependent methyltransferase [Acidobacteriia bacterium]|nr:class I SAM-dependent methyltransferase [Terriglobia bacterium]